MSLKKAPTNFIKNQETISFGYGYLLLLLGLCLFNKKNLQIMFLKIEGDYPIRYSG